jgi:hypothetical protein
MTMADTDLRKVAESLENGDEATLDVLDFNFIVTEIVRTPPYVNIFGKNEHHSEDGHIMRVEFGVDADGNITQLLIREYEEEDYIGLVNEESYRSVSSISVVNHA